MLTLNALNIKPHEALLPSFGEVCVIDLLIGLTVATGLD